MNPHKIARLPPIGRERMMRLARREETLAAIAEAAGACLRTARKSLV